MASNHTQHYGLCQWEATDAVLRADFNEDNAKLEAALNSQAGSISTLSAQMGTKANTGTVNSLSTQLSQEIQNRQNAVTAEASARQAADDTEKAAREAAVNALSQSHAADVAALRNENCWVKLGESTASQETETIDVTVSNNTGRELREILVFCNAAGAQAEGAIVTVNHVTDENYISSSGFAQKNIKLFDIDWLQGGCRLRFNAIGQEGFLCCKYDAYLSRSDRISALDGYCFLPAVTLSDVQSVQFFPKTGAVQQGTVMTVYGLLK